MRRACFRWLSHSLFRTPQRLSRWRGSIYVMIIVSQNFRVDVSMRSAHECNYYTIVVERQILQIHRFFQMFGSPCYINNIIVTIGSSAVIGATLDASVITGLMSAAHTDMLQGNNAFALLYLSCPKCSLYLNILAKRHILDLSLELLQDIGIAIETWGGKRGLRLRLVDSE
jgi:hypothetical protein